MPYFYNVSTLLINIDYLELVGPAAGGAVLAERGCWARELRVPGTICSPIRGYRMAQKQQRLINRIVLLTRDLIDTQDT